MNTNLKRLTESECADLRYLWHSYAADLGVKSVHGALERRLLLAPPREVWRPVLEELTYRHGGRASEGWITHIVVVEGWGTRREVRDAIRYLTRPSAAQGPRVERVASERPAASNQCSGRCSYGGNLDRKGRREPGCMACMWTGYDLRVCERGELRMSLALAAIPKTRADRWRLADERLESECQQMACHPGGGTLAQPDEVLSARKRAAVNRATLALSKMTAFDARVLQLVYGVYYATAEDEVAALRALVGGSRQKALDSREVAEESYRKARSAIMFAGGGKRATKRAEDVRIEFGEGWAKARPKKGAA